MHAFPLNVPLMMRGGWNVGQGATAPLSIEFIFPNNPSFSVDRLAIRFSATHCWATWHPKWRGEVTAMKWFWTSSYFTKFLEKSMHSPPCISLLPILVLHSRAWLHWVQLKTSSASEDMKRVMMSQLSPCHGPTDLFSVRESEKKGIFSL